MRIRIDVWRALLRTDPSAGPAIVRLALGAIMLAHGAGKLVEIPGFPGQGFTGTAAAFQGMGAPAPLAFLGVLNEALAGVLLIPGLATRFAGLVVMGQMAAAGMLSGHLAGGFFLPAGFEFELALFAMGASLLVTGGGRWSLDRLLARQRPVRALQ